MEAEAAAGQACLQTVGPASAVWRTVIQIDGSPHDWFEGRGCRCTLIVLIDDATSRLTSITVATDWTGPRFDNAICHAEARTELSLTRCRCSPATDEQRRCNG